MASVMSSSFLVHEFWRVQNSSAQKYHYLTKITDLCLRNTKIRKIHLRPSFQETTNSLVSVIRYLVMPISYHSTQCYFVWHGVSTPQINFAIIWICLHRFYSFSGSSRELISFIRHSFLVTGLTAWTVFQESCIAFPLSSTFQRHLQWRIQMGGAVGAAAPIGSDFF